MAIIQGLPDPVERAHYIQRLARLLNTREEFLLQAAETRPRRHGTPGVPAPEPEAPRSYDERLQDYVLALFLRAAADGADPPDPADFESAVHRTILQALVGGPSWPDPATALERLDALGPAFEPTLRRLRAVDEGNERLAADELVNELRVRSLELRKQRLFRQHLALDSVLREEADRLSTVEQREYEQQLALLASHLGRVFAEQRALGVVGSASSSIRRGREVLGG